jgi:hypothetical protein
VSTASAGKAVAGERAQLSRVDGSLTWGVRTLLGLAAVLSVAAIFAVWANRQLLDTGTWTRTNSRLLENRAIRAELSDYLTEQLYANVDLAGELRAGLPKQLKPLAAPAAGGLRTVVEKAIDAALRTPQVQALWRSASELSHRQFVALIENRGKVVRAPGGGAVVLDLRPVVASLASRLGTPAAVVQKLRNSVGEITIVRSRSLQTMQGAARGLHDLAIVLPPLALFMFALAIGLSRGRRSRALAMAGAVAMAAGLAALLVRSLLGSRIVDALTSSEAVRPAASAAWSILTSLLVEIAVATIAIGAVIVLAGLLAGRSQWASRARSRAAPYLRDRPDLVFGTAGAALLLVFLWDPIVATHSLVGIVTIAVLSLLGVQLLRRRTAVEFPGARYLPQRDGLRARVLATRTRLGGLARPDAGSAAVSRASRHHATQASAVDQLERLAALHAAGALTDAEFSAAKRTLLPD